MPDIKDVQSVIESLQGTGKTFAEFLALIFKDKFIEIYLGDSYEDISTEQVSTPYPSVFVGTVVAAYRECLILNCAYVDKSHTAQMGNMVFVNERAIRALNEVDGKGVIGDMMLRSTDSIGIKQAFEKKK